MHRAAPLALACLACVPGAFAPPAAADAKAAALDRKAIEALSERWWKARPKTAFQDWDGKTREDLLAQARALGAIPEGSLEQVRDLLWRGVKRNGPSGEGKIATPYGEAKWIQKGSGGGKKGLLIGLHGGGEGAGDAGEAAGTWTVPGCLGMYPQGIRLVHDTWNTVHGEKFVLTLVEIAKVQHEIDPDRVYAMGFSMGGTGSWFLAGRHPDLLAGAAPCAGVLMASPKSQLATKAEVAVLQHGFVPNVRNLAMWWFAGLSDRNCMPGTYLYAWDVLKELKAKDPGGYDRLHFSTYEGLGHAFPPGEPGKAIGWLREQRRTPYPAKVVWEYASDPFPLPEPGEKTGRLVQKDLYWVHCERPADRGTITATLANNEIDVMLDAAAPEDVTLFLNSKMIDTSKEVVLRVDGKETWRGRPVPDVATVLETLDSRLDRTLTFDRRVRCDGR